MKGAIGELWANINRKDKINKNNITGSKKNFFLLKIIKKTCFKISNIF